MSKDGGTLVPVLTACCRTCGRSESRPARADEIPAIAGELLRGGWAIACDGFVYCAEHAPVANATPSRKDQR